MTKKTLMLATAASAFLAAGFSVGIANAQDSGPYLQLNGGAHFGTNEDIKGTLGGTALNTDYDSDTGYYVGAALGKRLNDSFRVEGELAYRSNDIGSVGGVDVGGNVESTSLLLNGYYDFYTQGAYKPYIGAGLGIASVGADETDTVFAYQAKAGVGRELANGSQIGVEAAYFGTADVKVSDGTDSADLSYGGVSTSLFWRTQF